MKKFLSLSLALMLALVLAVPSYAAEPKSETVGVIVDGERITFSGAVPEVRDGKTMVPLKLLVEAMGGEVTPISGTLLCTFDGAASLDGKEVLVRPGSSSYYQNGCTYVPVRDIAEPLGYDVYWDSRENAAVLIDRQAVIDGIDRQFTILNQSLSQLQQSQDPRKSYRAQLDYALSVDALDEYSGQRTQMDINLTAAVLTSADAMEMELHMDLSDLSALLDDMGSTDSAALQDAVSAALEDVTLEGRYDVTTGQLYFRFPALSQLSALTGLEAGADDWYLLELPAMSSLTELSGPWAEALGISPEMLEQLQSGELNSVGGIIYFYSVLLSETPSQISQNAEMAGQIISQLFGDANFQSNGSSRTLHIGMEELETLMGQEGLLEQMFQTLGLDLSIQQNGNLSLELDAALLESYTEGEAVSLAGSMNLSGERVELGLSLHLSDLLQFQYNLTETIHSTQDQPQVTPPEGAAIVELGSLEELLGLDLSGAMPEHLPAA